MIGTIRGGGTAMCALFSKALPRLLEESRLKHADFSLFVALEELKIMENEKAPRDDNIVSFRSGDSTTFASAVCVDHIQTGPLMDIYQDAQDVSNPELLEKCSLLLNTNEDKIKFQRVGESIILFSADLPESQVTPTKTFCILAEVLISLIGNHEVSEIETIRFPIASAGTFHFHLIVEEDNVTLKMYNLFGCESGRMENISLGAATGLGKDLEQACVVEEHPSPSSNKQLILSCLKEMGFDVSQLTDEESFVSCGLDSLELAELEQRLSAKMSLPLPINCVEQNSTISSLSSFLSSLKKINPSNEPVIPRVVPSKWQRRILIADALESQLRAQFNEVVGFRISNLMENRKETSLQLNKMVQQMIIWKKSLCSTYTYEKKEPLSGTECYTLPGNEMTGNFVARPIDISNGPPLLWNIYDDVICILFHHVAVDGHSIRLIVKQLLDLYQGKELGPVIQYSNESTIDSEEDPDENEEIEPFPTDFPPPPQPRRRAAVYRKELPNAFAQLMRNIRSRMKATDFDIFCSAFNLANQKRTGNESIEIGMAVSVRRKEQEHLVDCLVAVVPVRLTTNDSDTVEEHVIRTARTLKLRRENAEKTKYHPVQVLLVMDKVEKVSYPGIEQVNVPTAICKHDQVWYFRKTGAKWEVVVEFCEELFHKETVTDSVNAVLLIMRKMSLSKRDTIVSEFSLGSFQQFQKGDFPKATISEIFDKRWNTQVFWQSGIQRVSQAEVEKRTVETARSRQQQYLCHYGETLSGDRQLVLFTPRGINLGIYVSSSWKLGLAVVPISRDWPTERIVETVKRFHNAMVVTDNEELRHRLRVAHVCVDDEREKRGTTIKRLWNMMSPSSLGYMTCTSGSTGQPKVVCSSIQGLSNLGANYVRKFSLNQRSVVYQVVNYAFDIFFADLIKAIVSGASIVFAEEPIPSLKEIEQCSCAYIMPAVLSSLPADLLKRSECLETLHFGGESIRPAALQRLLKIGTSLFQEFGLTEHSVYSSCSRQKVLSNVKHLGTPYPNQGFVLRDRNGNDHGGCGSRGELFVKGLVARGYHGMKEVNRQRFREGEMATRDMVCLQQDQLCFGGRMDLQVKILGRRVELGEVEAVVSKHPEVEMAVASVQNDKLYVHVTVKNKVEPEDLVSLCQNQLPAHMVPDEILFVDRIPLNANGKVDRKQLIVTVKHQEEGRREPQTEIERLVCEVMTKILGKEISMGKCFFRAGGNSLKAMFFMQEMRERGENVLVKDVFDLRTPEKIARKLEKDGQKPKNKPVDEAESKEVRNSNESFVPVTPNSLTAEISPKSLYPLSHIQRRLWFLQKLNPNSDTYKCTLKISYPSEVDAKKLKKSIEKIQQLNTFTKSRVVELEGTPFWEIPSYDASDLLTSEWKQRECYLHMNHLICDGRSLAILAEQLALLYNGLDIPIEPWTPPSKDQTDLSFWTTYLDEVTAPMFPERVTPKSRYSNEVARIKRTFPKKLENFIKSNPEKTFSFVVAAVVEVMRKVFDEEDIVIGTTIANRTNENNNTVGLFANTLPMRFKERTTDEVSKASEQIHLMMQHQNSSLEEIQRANGISDLLACVVNYQNVSIETLSLTDDLQLEAKLLESKHAQFPLSWIFSNQKEDLSLALEYDTGVVAEGDVQRWEAMFFKEMRRILASEKVRPPRRIVTVWDFPIKHLAEVIVKQGERSYSRVMMKTSKRDITYKDVLAESLSLAKLMEQDILKSLGRPPRPDDIIVIELKEGLHLHLFINAVLFLGCTYVVVSPTFPQERKLLILEETKPSLVITSFPPVKRRKVSFTLRASPDSLLYLMFTSGSTGRPKGVPIASAGVCNMLAHATPLYSLRPKARVLQFTKSHFDASISNTFGPFVNGGTLCLRSEEEEAAGGVRAHLPLTLLHMTPAVLEYLAREDDLIDSVESWSIGGESPSTSTVSSLLKKGSRLVQLYGPTEATCYQTASVLKCRDGVNNVGPGIPNVLVGICDWNNGVVGSEDVGQFFCGGIQLARGYLNDKEKTKRTFVPNPVLTAEDSILRKNTKIYLTGDRVRIDNSENLHFLGRRDQQVKVNGHRIELGEVESAISAIERVQSTAVVIQKDQIGKLHLVAFVTGIGLQEEDLLVSIRRKLPPHMVPMRVIPLCDLPMTANTKIDKKRLAMRADLVSKDIRCSEKAEEPKGLTIYKELLGDMEENDNFFFKGGHSLMANKLAYKLQIAFGVDVPVSKVFEHPTPTQMLKWIKEEERQKVSVPTDVIPRYSDRPSPLQLPLLRLYRNPIMHQVYNNRTEMLFHYDVKASMLLRLMNSLLLAHPALRTTFLRFGKSVKKNTLSGTECHLQPSDEEAIDVFRGIPVSISHNGRKVVIHTNHAAVDGRSMAILVQNLEILMKEGELKSDTSEGFNLWLETMFSKSREDSLTFWRKQLQDFTWNPLIGDLKENESSFNSRNIQLKVENLPSILSSLAKKHSSSPFSVLLAASAFSISQTSSRPSAPVSIGFPVNLRPDQFKYSVTMGVNTSLVLLSPSGNVDKDILATSASIASAMTNPLPFDEVLSLAHGGKVFDVMLTFDDYSMISNEFFTLKKTIEAFTKSPIAIFAGPNTEELSVDYMVDRFTEGSVGELLKMVEATLTRWYQQHPKVKGLPYQFRRSHQVSPPQAQMFISSESGVQRILPFLLELPEEMDRNRITQILSLLIQKHECLRTVFFLGNNGEPRQTLLSITETFHLPVYKVYSKESPPSSIVMQENVVELQIDGNLAVLWLHHIASDAWSTRIIESELMGLMINSVREVRRNQSSLIDIVRNGKIAARKTEAARLSQITNGRNFLTSQREDSSVFREYFDVSLEKNVFSTVVLAVVQSVLEEFPSHSLNIGFPFANRNTKNSHIVGYFLNNLVINVNNKDSLEQVEEKKTAAVAENATFSELVAEMRKICGRSDDPFQVYVNCRYNLETVREEEEKLMEMLPLNAEFPLEVDVDKGREQFRVTVRGKGEIFRRAEFDKVFEGIRRKLKRENKTLDTVLSVAQMILKRDVSAGDSFFAKGGTSLQAISLAEELEEQLGIEVEMEIIYASKSMADLAERLEGNREKKEFPQPMQEVEKKSVEANEITQIGKKEDSVSRIVCGKKTDVPQCPLSRILQSSSHSSPSRTLVLLPDHSKVTYSSFYPSVVSKSQSLLSAFIRLTGRPLRPDDIIPVVGQKSIDTWALCLAVVQSGAAYMPLDSSNPIERLNSAFKLSSSVCYLGEEVTGTSVPRILLNGRRRVSIISFERNLPLDVSYVISTSGTTGQPKAVCAVNRGVVNMVMAAVQDMRLTPRDVVFQFTNFCFDNSVLELFSSLAASSSVLIDPCLFSPRRFSRLVFSHNITHCLLFPALVSLFKDDTFCCLSALRYWVVGAEKLPKKLLERALKEGLNVIQNYGPTETTAYALTRHMRMGDEATNIGRAVQNCRTRLFDGELALSGSCLMRGYLGRKDAFRLHDGIQWYLTGDEVKGIDYGNTLFIGRKDNQVKIRGHRVELGEVEERVLMNPGVEQCRARWQEPNLTVYCVAPLLQEKDILEHCERSLPVYMRPNGVVVLQELPITPNAKVDFTSLEVPKNLLEVVGKVMKTRLDGGKSLLEHGGTTKEGLKIIEKTQKTLGWSPTIQQLMTEPLEEIFGRKEKKSGVREAWEVVLGHQDFDKDSHFLFSGGTSLHLLRLRQELNRRGIEVSVKQLMDMPKLGQMEMLTTPRVCSVVFNPPSPIRTLVFLHPLYGGCAPYIHLQNLLDDGKTKIVFVEHPNTLIFATEEPGFFESIDSLTTLYAQQVLDVLEGESIFIGGSIGGTLALEVARKLRNIPKAVILIDTLAEPDLNTYSFQQHKQQLLSECSFVDEAVLSNSWDLLQMLKNHQWHPVSFPLELFSVDGSDLGWNRLSPCVAVHRVSGPHSSLFLPSSSASLAASIRLLI